MGNKKGVKRGKYKIISNNKGWFKNEGKFLEKKCLICGTIFKSYKSNYCSHKCYTDSNRGKKRPEHANKMRELIKTDKFKKFKSTNVAWNKEQRKEMSDRLKKRWKNKDDYLNSDKCRQNLSDIAMINCKKGIMNIGYSRAKNGWYNINGKKIFFRSMWEANYALYLDFLIKQKEIVKWEFEVDTFWFLKIKRGVRSYKPDFKVYTSKKDFEYHEVKGWMDSKSKTKIKRMKIYYPEIKIVLIDASVYKDIKNKLGRLICFFEENL